MELKLKVYNRYTHLRHKNQCYAYLTHLGYVRIPALKRPIYTYSWTTTVLKTRLLNFMHFHWLKGAGLTSHKSSLTLHGMKSNTWFGEVKASLN